MSLNPETLERLRSVDTPTVLNSIEVAQNKRGYMRFTRGTMLAADNALPAICGYARTAKICGNTPSAEAPEHVRKRRMEYYRYMAEAPSPSVCVIEDIDYPDCTGAYWGEVNTTVHQGFGISGTLTNGVVRDLGDNAPGYQVIAGSVGPSHGFVHVTEIDVPVNIFGLEVAPGEFVHADRHGAVVIPADILPVIADAIDTMFEREALVLGPAREPGFDFEKFEKAWTAFENSRV